MMMVRYIGETSPLELTYGKTYEVLSIEKKWYRVIDDTGEDYLYHPELFEVLLQNDKGICQDNVLLKLVRGCVE